MGAVIQSKPQRLQALGKITADLDPLLKKILDKAEALYPPKKILSSGDWLWGQKERPQTFNLYNRPGIRNEVTQQRNKIYIFVIDERIDAVFLAKLKKYCAAFFFGMTIEIKYPEDTKTSKDFMDSHQIPSRPGYLKQGDDHRQYLTGPIL